MDQYADGSRLFAEHKYCGLLARQGWALAVVNDLGRVITSASGSTPWWAEGIYAAELWALLNATQVAFPGSPFIIDCKAVQVSSKNGAAWACSPSRRLGRAWAPLSRVLEEFPDCVTWMPAHCSSSAVGTQYLSNGELLSDIDLFTNDHVDSLAKGAARRHAPTAAERKHVVEVSKLVEDVAKWIAQATVLANHFPFTDSEGKKTFLRDSDARKRRSQPVFRTKENGGQKRKAGPASPDSFSSVLCVPRLGTQTSARKYVPATEPCLMHSFFMHDVPANSPKRRRGCVTCRDIDLRNNALFHAHWVASREAIGQFTPPPVSAASRLQAVRDRVLAKKERCSE